MASESFSQRQIQDTPRSLAFVYTLKYTNGYKYRVSRTNAVLLSPGLYLTSLSPRQVVLVHFRVPER